MVVFILLVILVLVLIFINYKNTEDFEITFFVTFLNCIIVVCLLFFCHLAASTQKIKLEDPEQYSIISLTDTEVEISDGTYNYEVRYDENAEIPYVIKVDITYSKVTKLWALVRDKTIAYVYTNNIALIHKE